MTRTEPRCTSIPSVRAKSRLDYVRHILAAEWNRHVTSRAGSVDGSEVLGELTEQRRSNNIADGSRCATGRPGEDSVRNILTPPFIRQRDASYPKRIGATTAEKLEGTSSGMDTDSLPFPLSFLQFQLFSFPLLLSPLFVPARRFGRSALSSYIAQRK